MSWVRVIIGRKVSHKAKHARCSQTGNIGFLSQFSGGGRNLYHDFVLSEIFKYCTNFSVSSDSSQFLHFLVAILVDLLRELSER